MTSEVDEQQMSLRREIIEALGDVAAAFEPDELAYLALTSKPELHVRDRWAWALMRRGLRVAREWRRSDLSIMDGGVTPLMVVELKCANTANVEWARPGTGGVRARFAEEHGARTYFEGLIRKDAAKARGLSGDGEAYVGVVLIHVADPVPRELDSLVKYGFQLRKVADRCEAEQKIDGYLARLGGQVTRVSLGAGAAFGLRCSVDVRLCGPLGEPEL